MKKRLAWLKFMFGFHESYSREDVRLLIICWLELLFRVLLIGLEIYAITLIYQALAALVSTQ